MRVIVSAGGTGGHIYPAIAIINKIKEREPNSEILYIGTHNRMEKDIVPKHGIPFKSIEMYGFNRKKIFKNFKTLSCLLKGVKECKKIIKDFKPDIVIGVGGYITVPVIYAANVSEDDFINGIENNAFIKEVEKFAADEGSEVLPICAKIEEDITEFDEEEKQEFLKDLGIEESGLERLIKKSYSLLGLISYLTAGKPEVRAWTIVKGTKAPQAAGKIHTDFEKGFIRAEVVAYDDLMACGTYAAAREKGLVRLEGKEYVMNDGDIVLFRFNVWCLQLFHKCAK